MHGLGGLLGLPGQLIELCQRVVGGIGLHTVRQNTAPRTVNPAIAEMTGRLTPRVVRCVRSSVKILRP